MFILSIYLGQMKKHKSCLRYQGEEILSQSVSEAGGDSDGEALPEEEEDLSDVVTLHILVHTRIQPGFFVKISSFSIYSVLYTVYDFQPGISEYCIANH